jgi:hypothetical protein
MKAQPNFSALLQPFFTDRLLGQRNASPQTIASYRDTFRLLLEFAQKQLHQSPSMLRQFHTPAFFWRCSDRV